MASSSYHRIVNFKSSGVLGISHKVFEEITATAIQEVEGCSISDTYALIFKRAPISCKFGKSGDLIINANIRVQYGYSVSEISKLVQERIERTMMFMTEIRPKKINLHVEDVKIEK
jgi:uncharacterized alkaline shock family protein YloU